MAAPPAWLDELSMEPGPPWWAMGVRGTEAAGWLAPDSDRDRDLAEKARLLAEHHDEVFIALDTAAVATASDEVLALISAATGEQPAEGLHALDAAGRLVQEDLCLLVPRDGTLHLDAGSLCFPSYWRLREKLGRPLAEVHGPVPGYAEELAAKVDGFLARLRTDRIVWRRNWSIHDDPSYFLPDATPPHRVDPPFDLYLRSERQTLRRLTTSAVLFTIRTQQVPLSVVAERPELAHRMAATIASWSSDVADYKAGHGALAAQHWLASC